MFYFEEIENKKILKTDALKGLIHCFTTRETMIKSNDTQDETTVKENKRIICKYFGVEPYDLISPTQTHSTNVQVADGSKTSYPDTDALILTNKKQAAFLNFADCTPIILYDEKLNISAVSHAGWRGTAGQIVIKTVEKMQKLFSSNPENIIAAIGPAIGQCCYCVNKDVAKKLSDTITTSNGCITKHADKFFVNLKEINRRQLLATGVTKIDLCDYCTSCANELFFSYRKENGTTKRHSAIIKLN